MPQSPVAPAERGDNTHRGTAESSMTTVPATIEIDLGIDPVAYQYESWSEMADGWVASSRSTSETMPNPDHEQIRNVTPLVPLADVEALVERLIVAGEINMPHERPDTSGDTSLP